MTNNNALIGKLEELAQRARQTVSDLIERRNALFAELVAEGETVQSRITSKADARRREIEARIDELKSRAKIVDDLRGRIEKAAKELRESAGDRIETLNDQAQAVRDRVKDRAEDLREAASNPVRWMYGQLNLATSSDLEQIKRQIDALRIRVAGLKAA